MKSFSKGRVLEYLNTRKKGFKVLPIFLLSTAEYRSSPNKIISEVVRRFSSSLIVRSSARDEDTICESQAGSYSSVLNVPVQAKEIRNAIEKVCSKFKSDSDEVLIQPMLYDIVISGVVFTCDPNTGAPYYIVNYSDDGQADSITSGKRTGQTLVIYKNICKSIKQPRIKKLIDAVSYIEDVFSCTCLDIEFAFDRDGDLFVFQVRPLVLKEYIETPLRKFDLAYRKMSKLFKKSRHLLGRHVFYGMMTDWNPAEMIGMRPKPLALSLYKDLITDKIWSKQRKIYGYRDLTKHSLMVSFSGYPYVNILTDFNSFVPASLSKHTAEKLVDYYCSKLKANPFLHDKVEFEVALSCYTLSTHQQISGLAGFTQAERDKIESSLKSLTERIVNPRSSAYINDVLKISLLEQEYCRILEKKKDVYYRIVDLLNLCKRYGTLPFAGIARSAFIGKQFLDSLLDKGIISSEELSVFMKSLNTISNELSCDTWKYRSRKLSKKAFLKKWGHLRPNTYDITSLRYDENFDVYFRGNISRKYHEKTYQSFSFARQGDIDLALSQAGMKVSGSDLIEFIAGSIRWREKAKWMFTKIVSEILFLIKERCLSLGITPEEVSFLDLRTLLRFFKNPSSRTLNNIRRLVCKNKSNYQLTRCLRLPEVIFSEKDLHFFYQTESVPTFVTQNRVAAPIVIESDLLTVSCKGKIVLLASADPGYDFLFTKGIAGLITQFGGANSHMAIRCAEIGIPAAIGAGEKMFDTLQDVCVVELDALDKQIRVLS